NKNIMKTLELKLPTPVLHVWGSPNGFMVYSGNNGYTIMPPPEDISSRNTFTQPVVTVSPCWQLIGKLSELTEEEAGTIVGKNYWDMGTGGYIDYASDDPTDSFVFPLQSF